MRELDNNRYQQIVSWCQKNVQEGSEFLFDTKLFRSKLQSACDKWDFAFESLHSLLRNIHLHHVKIESNKVKRNLKVYLEDYKRGRSILTLAKQANYPPYLFCRYIVEQVANIPNGKRGLTQAMRDPMEELKSLDIIKDPYLEAEEKMSEDLRCGKTRLALEVKKAIDSDPMYGPIHDQRRHFVGLEYEVALEKALAAMNIPFETESQLREKGSSRTPDVLLSCPIGVQVGPDEWKVICWIDSKALFGDTTTHNTSVLPQAESYVHRFGPGMILYWFGHAPLFSLGDAKGDVIVQEWQLPQTFLWPTGEMGGTKFTESCP